MKNYKINKTNLFCTLCGLEDKIQYKSKSLSKYIDKLQKDIDEPYKVNKCELWNYGKIKELYSKINK